MNALREAVRLVLGGSPSAAPASDTRISWETVESVTGLNECVVLGQTLPVTGLATFPVGARVPVAWRNGTPVAVIGHRTRRAQFHPSRRRTAQGIVEELLVGNFDNTAPGIWYRTHDRLEAITDGAGRPLTAFPQASTPQAVQWGLDGKSFGVQCSSGVYAVYALGRDDPNAYDASAPGSATLLWSGTPLTSTIPLCTVTWTNRLTRTIKEWIGKVEIWGKWVQAQTGWSSGGIYYWAYVWDRVVQDWETTLSASGTASAGGSKTFPLKDVLAGTIVDYQHNSGRCTGRVVEWYLDADRQMRFIILAKWDYFWLGTSATGQGSVTWPVGYGTRGLESYTETFTVGGGAGVIGAKRQSDQQTIDEQHVFLLNAATNSVEWSTAAPQATVGNETFQFAGRLLEHNLEHVPQQPSNGGLPDPHWPDPPGGIPPAEERESYYAGANWSNLPQTLKSKNEGQVGDERGQPYSSTGTFQLFDPQRCPALSGPYGQLATGTFHGGLSIIGGLTVTWQVLYETRTGGYQLLWFHRVAGIQALSRRAAVSPVDEPLFFLVLERYPFIQGTGYINDLPMTWVGIVDRQGAIVHTLRPWQYGLSGQHCTLIDGNGHRLFWTCGIGAIQPETRYVYTDLDTHVETTLTRERLLQFLASRRRLLTPDFCWERLEPQGFYALEALPALEPDEILAEYGALLGTEGGPEGSVRVINDEEILSPLERYQTI